MWHLFRGSDQYGVSAQYGPPHFPLSRNHIRSRVNFHISLGCLLRGIRLFDYFKRGQFEPPHADRSAIAKSDKSPSFNDGRFHFVPADNSLVPFDGETDIPARRGCNAVTYVSRLRARVSNAANIKINWLIRILCGWVNILWAKIVPIRKTREMAIKHDLIVQNLKGACDSWHKGFFALLDAAASFSNRRENIGWVNEGLTVPIERTGFSPFLRIVSSNATSFLFLKRECVRGESVPKVWPCSANGNPCLDNVIAHAG